jgi:hypothetical protein
MFGILGLRLYGTQIANSNKSGLACLLVVRSVCTEDCCTVLYCKVMNVYWLLHLHRWVR